MTTLSVEFIEEGLKIFFWKSCLIKLPSLLGRQKNKQQTFKISKDTWTFTFLKKIVKPWPQILIPQNPVQNPN